MVINNLERILTDSALFLAMGGGLLFFMKRWFNGVNTRQDTMTESINEIKITMKDFVTYERFNEGLVTVGKHIQDIELQAAGFVPSERFAQDVNGLGGRIQEIEKQVIRLDRDLHNLKTEVGYYKQLRFEMLHASLPKAPANA